MNTPETIEQIAADFGLSRNDLLNYALDDEIGGYDGGKGTWPLGAIWSGEGQILYALVRALRPDNVYEIGYRTGCSSAHITAALDANKKGKLHSTDTGVQTTYTEPVKAQRLVAWMNDGATLLAKVGKTVKWPDGKRRKLPLADIIFDDGSHSPEDIEAVARLAQERLVDGGLLIVHDAAHFIVGEGIMQGLAAAGLTGVRVYLPEPSDCGLAIWRKPEGD
jgi:hypothetical protein